MFGFDRVKFPILIMWMTGQGMSNLLAVSILWRNLIFHLVNAKTLLTGLYLSLQANPKSSGSHTTGAPRSVMPTLSISAYLRILSLSCVLRTIYKCCHTILRDLFCPNYNYAINSCYFAPKLHQKWSQKAWNPKFSWGSIPPDSPSIALHVRAVGP